MALVVFRGVYFVLLSYTGDGSVLSTVDDQLPIIEVDDNYPASLAADFQWLQKVRANKCFISVQTSNLSYVLCYKAIYLGLPHCKNMYHV